MSEEFDLAGALRRFPLPDGLPDATMTLTELAQAMNLSEPTLKRYIVKGMPVASEGGRGRGYELRLSECYAWKMWQDASERERRERVNATVNQLRLAFRNDDEDAVEPGQMLSPREIAEESEAEIKRLKAAQLRGDLVPTDRVRETIERALVAFRNGLISLPDFAEVELGLPPSDADKLQRWVDGVLQELEVRIAAAVAPEGDLRQMAGERG